MALIRQSFTRSGNAPDVPTLANAIRPTISDPFYLSARPGFVDIDKPTVWSGGDVTTVQAAVTACVDATAQTDAQNQIDALPILTKAIVLTLLDEINILRAAVVPSLAARTPAQAIAAVRNKAGSL